MSVISADDFLSGNVKQGSYNVKYKYNGKTFYFHVEVGSKIDENTAINFNGYGAGVSGSGKYIDEYLDEHEQNCIDIRYRYGHDEYGNSYDGYRYNGWDEAAAEFMKEIEKKYGLNPDNSMVMGYSSTAVKTMQLASEYAERNNSNGNVALIIEAVPDHSLSRSDVKTLIDHDSIVINAYANDDHSLRYGRKDTCNGLHMLDLKFNITRDGNSLDWGTKHGIVYRVLAEYGITDLSSDNFDFTKLPSEFEFEGKKYKIDYDLTEYYTDANGKYTSRSITPEQANALFGTTDKSMFDLSSVLPEDVIESDNEYLSQGLTLINSMIRTSSVDGISIEGYSSTTNTPSAEGAILNKMIRSCSMILEKLGTEIKTIGKIGDRFKDMDNFLEDEASTLGMEITSGLVPPVEAIDYESKDPSSIIPVSLVNELANLKEQINNNSEENPFIEGDEEFEVPVEEDNTEIPEPPKDTSSTPEDSPSPDEEEVSEEEQNQDDSRSRNNISISKEPIGVPSHDNSSTPSNPSKPSDTSTPSDPVIDVSPEREIEPGPEQTVPVNTDPSQAPSPSPVSTNENVSDDSYRELIPQELEEIKPKVSDKKEKTPIIPSKIKPKKETETTKPVEPKVVEPEKPAEVEPDLPVTEVEPEITPIEDKPIDVPVEEKPIVVEQEENTDRSDLYKTIGIAAGMGVGIGAVAYGVNNQIKKKETKDGFVYAYEDDEKKSEYDEEEKYEEQYSPYSNEKEIIDENKEKEGDE